MSYAELIKTIAKSTGSKAADVRIILDAMMDEMHKITSGDSVSLPIGKMGVRYVNARMGRNPNTGEPMTIGGKNIPFFNPSKSLKDAAKGDGFNDTASYR